MGRYDTRRETHNGLKGVAVCAVENTCRTSRLLLSKDSAFAHVLALLIAVSLSLGTWACLPTTAMADVRRSDVVAGGTISDRGLSASVLPTISAEYAYVIDSDGKVYFERQATSETKIASITKIMTAVVAMEHADMNKTIEVSSDAASVGESSADLRAGDTLSLEDAIKGLMIPSGNDAAIAISETIGKDILSDAVSASQTLTRADGSSISAADQGAAQDAFVAKMNEKAKELGCENTLFTNAHGLDSGVFASDSHSSAKDVATISAYAMKNDTFAEIVSSKSAVLDVMRAGSSVPVTVESTDELIGAYDGACGIKTGYTDAAGACFSGACLCDDRYMYAVVLDSESEAARFEDAQKLFDWVYNSFVDYELANSDATAPSPFGESGDVPVVAYAPLAAWTDRTVSATLADPDAKVEVSSLFGNISQDVSFYEVPGAVSAGDVVGKVSFYQNNQTVAEMDLVACESIAAPDIFQSVSIWLTRLGGIFTGDSNVAEGSICNRTPLLMEKS